MTDAARSGIYAQVQAERERQDAKWGGPDHDANHTAGDWISFIAEHADKALRAEMGPIDGDADLDEYRRRLIEVAALAVAAVEALDKQRGHA